MPQNIGMILERTRREMEEARMISELSLSPVDGTAAFLLRRTDFAENRYRQTLYRQRGEQAPECLGEGAWSGIIWTKQGKLIGVQRTAAGTRLMRITDSGAAEEERVIPRGGKPIAINESGDCVLSSRTPIKNKNADKSVIFTDEYPLFHNDIGLMANTRGALLYYCAETGELRQITEETFTVNLSAVDLDSGMIVAAGKEYAQTPGYCEEIRVYSVDGGLQKRFLADRNWSISHLVLWKGKIVFAGTNVDLGVQSGTWLMQIDPDSGEMTTLSDQDVCLSNTVICDYRFGAGKSMVPAEDGIYASVTRNEQSELWRFSRETGWEVLCDSMDTVDMLDVVPGRVVFSGHADLQRTEMYDYLPDGTVKKRTAFHPALSGPAPEAMSVTVNGKEIRGFVLPPEELQEGRLYPAILSIHGGPRTIFGRPAGHDHRILSQGGAFVIWCNPTGSDGRGSEFYDLKGHWGSEMPELIAFVEEAVRRYPIDPKRLGVFGASYGGYMTNYLLGKTNLFAAAVSERSIAILPWQEMLSDLPTSYRTKQFAGGIFEAEERMWAGSPLHFMETCAVPTLFIQGDADYRCPLVNGASVYQKLIRQGTDARMIVFHKENHAVNRMGKPWNRLKRYQEIYLWFAKYLCFGAAE